MLEHFFGSKTRLKLLQIFFRNPSQAFYLRELARLVHGQLNGVRREIAYMEQMGLVKPATAPAGFDAQGVAGTERAKYFQLEEEFILYPEIKALLLKLQLMEQQAFIDQLKGRAGEVTLFLLTGMFTGVKTVPTDLILAGNIKPVVVTKIIKNFEESAGHPLRYTIMDHKEFEERREIGDVFIYDILEAKHVVVIDTYRLVS